MSTALSPSVRSRRMSASLMGRTSFYELETMPVFIQTDIPQLHEGGSLTFKGFTQLDCERFSVNLLQPDGDVALHINPRLPQNYIVRNTKVKNVWGREEVSSPLPFNLRRGHHFTLQVLITEACFMISVNGCHFAEYAHRLPYQNITDIQVKGDVRDVSVERQNVDVYPEHLPHNEPREVKAYLGGTVPPPPTGAIETIDDITGRDEVDAQLAVFRMIPTSIGLDRRESKRRTSMELPLPYYGQMSKYSLINGRALRIDGRIKLLPHSFYINLQNSRDIWPHPLVSFHFNPRFSKQSGTLGKAIVCRNTWDGGQWGEEERSELDTDLRPGKVFSLAILCSEDSFEVYVNRKFLLEFKYQVQPCLTDVVYIQGDIKLWNVLLEKNSLLSNGRTHLYENPSFNLTTR